MGVLLKEKWISLIRLDIYGFFIGSIVVLVVFVYEY